MPMMPPTPVEDLRFEDIDAAGAGAGNTPTVPLVGAEAEDTPIMPPGDVQEHGNERQHEVQGGDTNDFYQEVNEDMDATDEPLRELVKMWDAGLQRMLEKRTARSLASLSSWAAIRPNTGENEAEPSEA